MGQVSLLLPQPLPPPVRAALERATFAVAYDLSLLPVPLPSRAVVDDGRLCLFHDLSESGHVLVPWLITDKGCRIVESASLCNRNKPYRLLVELARGELHQLRQHVEEWTAIGLELPQDFTRALRDVTRLFIAALSEEDAAVQDRTASVVLEQCGRLSDQLVREFTSQMFETRIQEEGRLSTRLAAQIAEPWGTSRSEYMETCNAVHLNVSWRQVEEIEGQCRWQVWDQLLTEASQAAVPITVGPLVDLSVHALPEWLLAHRGDLPTLAALMCDYVETVIQRYRSIVRRWIIAAGLNVADPLGLDDDQRLRLAQRLLTAALQVDPELEVGLRLAQPWGDYLCDKDSTISPLMFADDLLRSGLSLAIVDLEVRFGPMPRASLARDLLDTVRMLGLYEILGVPLAVTLALPASLEKPTKDQTASTLCPLFLANWGPKDQAEWGAALTALALCLPHVQAVTWESWTDRPAPAFPSIGLLDAEGCPRPLFHHWRQLRSRFLQ